MTRRNWLAVLALPMVTLLAGCGRKGPLRLPEPQPDDPEIGRAHV